jgi:hypothetical protein
MPDYDSLYHRLYGHPRVGAQLLRDFVAGSWLDDLDLGGMELLNAKFQAGTRERRSESPVWWLRR